MTDWLKTTIPGVIILGAVGSILAVGILKLLIAIARKSALHLGRLGDLFVMTYQTAPERIIESLRTSDDIRRLIVTCTVCLAGIILPVAAMFAGLLVFLIASLVQSDRELHPIAIAGTVLFFTMMIATIMAFRNIWKIYMVFMGDVEEEAYFKGGNTKRLNKAEQDGAGQPATRSESDSEGGDKPQPESDGRSR